MNTTQKQAWPVSADVKISDEKGGPEAAAADSLDEGVLRRMLCMIEDDAALSQRQLARELGIALGSVNWYLKRCINKGLIKISQVPLRRYAYYLTPKGMEEKGRLTAQYLRWSLDFFRMGREESASILARCAAQGRKDILLAGDSDLAEIFIMSAVDTPVTIHAIYQPGGREGKRLRVPITATPSAPQGAMYILTETANPQAAWDDLRARGVPAEEIIIPSLLYFKPATKESA